MKRIKHILFTMALLLGSLAATAQNEEPIDIASNADKMLYTNAKCTNTAYGDQFVGWHVLFDNKASTFFHSEYSNKNSEDGLDHYLRVDLGNGGKVNAFSFTYTVRGTIPNNGNYSPKTMIVEGSNTAYGTYTELVSLNNLPNTGAAVYKSPVIRNGTAYRYIRFRVTETYTNSKVQGHSYFFMAEFGMMRVRIEGTCGDNLSWKLTDDNELIIEGTGKMYDYPYEGAPWYEYRESIQTITMGEGVTSIGNRAFEGCDNLTSITIPESVTSIGSSAFYKCSSLTAITLPEGVTSIGGLAFQDCSSLTSITIPESVTSIGSWAFDGCSSLAAIVVEEGNNVYDSRGGCNAIIETSSNTLTHGCSATIIPESVTSIGYYAFYGCSSLTAITIPESVTSIGYYAFGYCGSLTTITIPENSQLTNIGDRAFEGCSSLTSITIPEGVTSIGSSAFYNCSSLTAITIPEGVTSIGYEAFYGCSSLTSITIPESVTSIGSSAFYGCIGELIVNCNIPPQNSTVGAFNGSKFNKVTFGEGVTSIGDEAFDGCSSLTAITIPENSQLTSIGNGAFYGCSSLTTITIPESVTSIGNGAFHYCIRLTAITIPEGVTSIGSSAFRECSSLTAITCHAATPPTIDGSYTFNGVDKSIPVYVPAGSVEAFKAAAYWSEFTNYQPLSSDIASGTCGDNLTWRLTEEYELVIEGTGDMYDYSPETTPWYEYRESMEAITIKEGITSIGDCAFHSCSKLKRIDIPEGVVAIGETAMCLCNSVALITLPASLTEIDATAFNLSGNIIQFVVDEGNPIYADGINNAIVEKSTKTLIAGTVYGGVPDDIEHIGDYAFCGRNVEGAFLVPEGVVSIGRCAFLSSSISSIRIPKTLKNCGDYAFQALSMGNLLSEISEVYIDDLVAWLDIEFMCEGSNPLCNGASLYLDNNLLESIVIPEDITNVKRFAFDGWNGENVVLPKSVISVGYLAFNNCSNLTSITCEATTPPAINCSAFYEVDKSIPVYVPSNSVEVYKSAEHWSEFTNYQPLSSDIASGTCGDNLTWRLTGEYELFIEGTGEMYDYSPETTPWYEHRESIQNITMGEGVTSIGSSAFSGCSSLTSITIPEGVTSIGAYAFDNCSSLTAVHISSITAWCEISFSTFDSNPLSYAHNLYINGELVTELVIPHGVTSIESCAFGGCSNLTAITLPEGVTSIGWGAFQGCSSLTAITIPEGVTSIGIAAFSHCRSLTAIAIPASVTSIGDAAFYDCSSLTDINIPESVTSIGSSAFHGCSNLTAITIPEGVTSIGDCAFFNCSSLTTITCTATTPPTIGGSQAFYSVDKSIPVYVPAGSVEAYKSAEHWSEFTNYQTIEGPAPEAVTITISKYGSGTYSSAYALDFSEVQGLKAYVATGYNYHTGVVTLLRVHTADAATGLLVKGTPGASYEVPVMEYTADRTLNMLVPTLERTEVDSRSNDGVYANYKYTVDPAQNPDEPLFYPFVDNSHLSAGKAYLQIPVAWLPDTGQKSIRYRFDEGETTDIEDEEIRNQKSSMTSMAAVWCRPRRGRFTSSTTRRSFTKGNNLRIYIGYDKAEIHYAPGRDRGD